MRIRLFVASLLAFVLNTAHAGQTFLKPEQAFDVRAVASTPHSVTLRFHIAKGYYLYRDKIHIAAVPPAALGALTLPPGVIHNIPYYGKTVVYEKSFTLAVPLAAAAPHGNTVLNVGFQGCAVNGICYPPRTKAVASGGGVANPGGPPAGSAPPGHSLILELLAAFGAGLLLTFTPCVLPMIPILSSVIVGRRDRPVGRARAATLSLAYVLGTATTYAAIGALAGATGDQLQAYFENVWGIGALATLFVVLSLSMFGLFELQMPAALQSRLQGSSQGLKGGSLVGGYLLGLVSALVIGACVSPLVISGLSVAISQHSALLGAALMFSMALGMGVILVALGLGAGFLLPKAGAWMEQVKHLFGFMLLGVAIYLLTDLPAVPGLWLWSLWLVSFGVALGATQSLASGAGVLGYAKKGVGTFLLIWGALALAGAMEGGHDVLRPLPRPSVAVVTGPTQAPAGTPAGTGRFHRVTNLADLDRLLRQARRQGRPALVDFYASWCTDCIRLERETFANPGVQTALHDFVLIQADVTRNDADSTALKKRFGIYGPPALLFFDATGHEHRRLRSYGFEGPNAFIRILKEVRS